MLLIQVLFLNHKLHITQAINTIIKYLRALKNHEWKV